MQLNHLLTIQQFMQRATLTGAETNAFAICMNALQAEINALQKPLTPPLPQIPSETPA